MLLFGWQAEADALKDKAHELDYKRLERDNILKDIDDLTDANQGLKRALDEAQQEVCPSYCTPLPNDSKVSDNLDRATRQRRPS